MASFMVYDPHRRWTRRAACKDEDVNSFFPEIGAPNRKPSPATQARLDRRKEICRTCPVLAECRRDTLGEDYGIWGGLDAWERHKIRMKRGTDPRSHFTEEEFRWLGPHIIELRRQGDDWSSIGRRIGLGRNAASNLLMLWQAEYGSKAEPKEKGSFGQGHLSEEAKAEILHLRMEQRRSMAEIVFITGVNRTTVRRILGEDSEGNSPLKFPERAGERDAWVRVHRQIHDADYVSQTPDDQFFLIKTRSGHVPLIRYVPAKDIRFHRRHTPVYAERGKTRGGPSGPPKQARLHQGEGRRGADVPAGGEGGDQAPVLLDAG